jgi:hypothetical protein
MSVDLFENAKDLARKQQTLSTGDTFMAWLDQLMKRFPGHAYLWINTRARERAGVEVSDWIDLTDAQRDGHVEAYLNWFDSPAND